MPEHLHSALTLDGVRRKWSLFTDVVYLQILGTCFETGVTDRLWQMFGYFDDCFMNLKNILHFRKCYKNDKLRKQNFFRLFEPGLFYFSLEFALE